jgi:hypothetical protein
MLTSASRHSRRPQQRLHAVSSTRRRPTRLHVVTAALTAALALLPPLASAATVSIPLDDSRGLKAPASDLLYKGQALDPNEAADLARRERLPLWQLDPAPGVAWKGDGLDNNQDQLGYPAEGATVFYDSRLPSPTGNFRVSVDAAEPAAAAGSPQARRAFTATFNVEAHGAIVRAVLMRKMGWDVNVPRYYKRLKIAFPSLEAREAFIGENGIGDQTLTSNARWIIDQPKDRAELTLKGAVLEPGRLLTTNAHWGTMSAANQRTLRVFRAMIVPFVLADFVQKINTLGWDAGRVFDQKIVLNHPSASEFRDVTIDDARWAVARLARLDRADFVEAARAAALPTDIEALLAEKLISRRNHFLILFDLENLAPSIPANTQLRIGNVRDGQLTAGGAYDDYAIQPFEESAKNPFRASELFQYFKTNAIYSGVSALMSRASNDYLSPQNIEKANEQLREEIQAARDHYQEQAAKDPSGNLGYFEPIKGYVAPTMVGGISTSRGISFGQFLGSDAPIQLVDTLSARVELGAFGLVSGLNEKIVPTFSGMVAKSRNYIHIRPIEDIGAGSRYSPKNLVVPVLLNRLTNILEPDQTCDYEPNVWVVKTDSSKPANKDAIIKFRVFYDDRLPPGKDANGNSTVPDLAKSRRQQLINEGAKDSEILLEKANREAACQARVEERITDNVQAFTNELGANESFLISDQIDLSTRVGATVPITAIPRSSVSLSAERNKIFVRTIIFKNLSGEGFEIVIQNQRKGGWGGAMNLNLYLSLMDYSMRMLNGDGDTDVFRIKMTGASAETKQKALRAIKALLKHGNEEILRENFAWHDTQNEVKSRISTLNFLWWKREKFKLENGLTIALPRKASDPSTEQRELYITMSARRRGSDYFGFANRAVGSFVNFFSLSGGSADPGRTWRGHSERDYVTTEGELTPARPFQPVTKLDFYFNGWSISPKDLDRRVFRKIEKQYGLLLEGRPLFNRGLYQGATEAYMGYEIRNTIVLYPSALEKIERTFTGVSEEKILPTLTQLFGDEWVKFCEMAARRGTGSALPIPKRTIGGQEICVHPDAHDILFSIEKYRKGLSQDRKKRLQQLNHLVAKLVDKAPLPSLLTWIGTDHFFGQARTIGFRRGDNQGATDQLSSSIGRFNTNISTGVFDQMSADTGISGFYLRALDYAPGM